MSYHALTIDSMYRYDGKNATTPSGTVFAMSIRIEPKLRTTAGSFRTSKRELIGTWSLPRVMTMGKKAFRVRVIGYDSWMTGWNCSIFGYMSSGEMVPDVMMTLLKRSNTGAIASDGSRQLFVS